LSGFDRCSLVDVALVFDIQFSECILKAKNLLLLELGILPKLNLALIPNSGEADENSLMKVHTSATL
jgi:hypothetical protein